MARRKRQEAGKAIPAWLLTEHDRPEEASAWCRQNDVSPLLVIRYRARLKSDSIRLRRSELAEIATWIVEDDPA